MPLLCLASDADRAASRMRVRSLASQRWRSNDGLSRRCEGPGPHPDASIRLEGGAFSASAAVAAPPSALTPPQAPRARALWAPPPTAVPPSSASRSAAQRWRFSSPKGWPESLGSDPGHSLDAAIALPTPRDHSRAKASHPLPCDRCELRRARFSLTRFATPIAGSTN